jgi:NAD(P) transhydrogenase subunit alpha
VQVSAAPAPVVEAAPAVIAEPKKPASWQQQVAVIGGASIALIALLSFAPLGFLAHVSTLVLATVVGYYVVWNVSHALHTPLMSVTNAVSGVIIVGALLQMESTDWTVRILAAIAILVASINIFGGFTVSNRMLTMFRRG